MGRRGGEGEKGINGTRPSRVTPPSPTSTSSPTSPPSPPPSPPLLRSRDYGRRCSTSGQHGVYATFIAWHRQNFGLQIRKYRHITKEKSNLIPILTLSLQWTD